MAVVFAHFGKAQKVKGGTSTIHLGKAFGVLWRVWFSALDLTLNPVGRDGKFP